MYFKGLVAVPLHWKPRKTTFPQRKDRETTLLATINYNVELALVACNLTTLNESISILLEGCNSRTSQKASP